MGPPSYMRSVVDRNVVMRRMTVFILMSPRLFALQQFLVRYYIILYCIYYIVFIILYYASYSIGTVDFLISSLAASVANFLAHLS